MKLVQNDRQSCHAYTLICWRKRKGCFRNPEGIELRIINSVETLHEGEAIDEIKARAAARTYVRDNQIDRVWVTPYGGVELQSDECIMWVSKRSRTKDWTHSSRPYLSVACKFIHILFIQSNALSYTLIHRHKPRWYWRINSAGWKIGQR